MQRSEVTMTATLTRLEHLLGDRLLVPGSPGFQDAARVEFGAFDRIPAAVAQVTTTAEVAAAVRAARDHDLPVAVRAGGHSCARHALAADALVLDLRRMDAVTIDPERRLGLAEGGATAGAYGAAAAQYGLGTGFGDTPTVGIAGLTLGGGSGFLRSRAGLTVDNLLGAEVVLADGRVVTTDERHEPDLFWALRGGGGNFGVVTSLTFRLQPTPVVTGGLLILEPTPAAVAGAVEAVLAAPDGLSALVNVLVAPPMPMLPEAVHGRPVLMLVPCWSGLAEEAEAALAPLRALGEPLFDDVAARRYPELLQGPPGSGMVLHPVMRTGFVDRVDEAWAADAVGSLASAASPMAAVSLRPLGGAVARTAPTPPPSPTATGPSWSPSGRSPRRRRPSLPPPRGWSARPPPSASALPGTSTSCPRRPRTTSPRPTRVRSSRGCARSSGATTRTTSSGRTTTSRRSPAPRSAVERQQQPAQQPAELLGLLRCELGEKPVLRLQEVGHRGVDLRLAQCGEPDEDHPPVGRAHRPDDQSVGDHPVDPVRHRPRRHERLVEQAAGGQLVGLPGAPQRRQDVELPALELVGDERPAPGEVEPPGEPGDAGEDVQRPRVEIGSFPLPRRDDPVDLVLVLEGAAH